jgi:hypothetical protein
VAVLSRSWVGVLLGLGGCTHLSTLEGAVPVDPGYSEFTVDLQASRAPNPVQTPIAIPLPSFAFHVRHGLSRNLDFGAHVYPLGLGVDMRYRFAELQGWSLAAQPGVGGLLIPVPGLQYGQFDASFPVRAEHSLARGWGVAFGPGLLARQTFFATEAGDIASSTATFELYAGGGARIFHDWPKLRLGISGDLYVDTLRATGLYGGLGVDFSLTRRGGKSKASSRAGMDVSK